MNREMVERRMFSELVKRGVDQDTADQVAQAVAASLTPLQGDDAELPCDSGMNGDAVVEAEMVWAQLPTGNRSWAGLATHEKALVCHTLARLKADRLASPSGDDAELVERLRIIRGTQFTPTENALVTEAADRLAALVAERNEMREALADAREMLVHFRREAPLDCQPAAGVVENLLTKIDAALQEQDHGK